MAPSKETLFSFAPWVLFVTWFLVAAAFLIVLARSGVQPIDYQSYQRAAKRIARGRSPYLTPEASQQIWQKMHRAEVLVMSGEPQGSPKLLQAGPYLYPPTLALLIHRLHIDAAFFVLVLLSAVCSFGWIWIRSARVSGWWLLLIVGSWDVLATFLGGNVETLLLLLALLSARLLWTRQGAGAAPLIALTILIKPFYALFYVSFGLLLLVTDTEHRSGNFRALAIAASLVLVIAGIDIGAWGALLRAEACDYLRHALDYQWFALPFKEQTPMSIWNRTPMQGLIAMGLAATTAQLASYVLWFFLLTASLRRFWGHRLGFPMVFAVSFVLFYLGRPIGWGLVYLEVVVLVALRPALRGPNLAVILGLAVILMLSHWWALLLTVRGEWLNFFTMQTATLPWETWTVLPSCWVLLIVLGRSSSLLSNLEADSKVYS